MWLDFRRKRFWVWALSLTYILAGFFVAPPILRREIVDSLHRTIERPVALDELRINPLALSVDLRGFHVADTDGSPLIGFDRLYIRFSLNSLLRRAWCFDDLRLEGIKGNIVRYSETDSNIGRIIGAMGKPADAATPGADHGLPRLIVRQVSIVNATADFTDHVPARPFKTTVGPANVEISHISTLPQETGEEHIAIAMEGGATLEWTGHSGLNPLTSTGHVTANGPYLPLLARYFEEATKVSVPTGTLSAQLDYRLQGGPDGALALAVDQASLVLSNLALREQGVEAPFLTVPEIRLAGAHLAWPEKTAGADTFTISGANVALRRQKDGQFGPLPSPTTRQPTTQPTTIRQEEPATPAPATPLTDWSVALGKAEIKNAKVQFDDQAVGEAAKLEIAPFDLSVDTLSNKPGAAFPFSLATGVASGGHIAMQGRLSLLPNVGIEAKLKASDLRLAGAQAYLHQMARIGVEDGRLDAETDVRFHDAEGLTLAGRGEIQALKLKDEVENSLVASWTRLAIDRYEYRQAANDLQISQVTIGGPYLRFQVAANQSTNFSHIIVGQTKPGNGASHAPGHRQRSEPVAPPVASSGAPAGSAPPMKIGVGKVVIAQGTADYGDASLPLPFAAHISNLQGEVASLSSAEASPSRVALRGQVGEFGQVKIDGRLTPFDLSKSTKIDVLFRNVEFPGLSPYTVKFAGRRIARGRLDVDLKYAIDEGKLNGANRVVIRDIQLGDKVDVPGAMDLPLELAIALLKDQDGKIDIDLPVSGNLNDPQFDIGAVISKVISNLVTNLVTAPFKALVGLLGGEEETLDHIDFRPGRAELEPPEKEKILHLAKALAMRPRLALVVPGVVDPEADRRRLQFDALDAKMAKDLGDHNTVKRQRQFLETLFEEKLGSDQLGSVKQTFTHPREGASEALDEPGYVDALRERVAKTEPIAETSLTSLAEARATAVANALKQVPGLDPRRITQQGSSTAQAADDGAIPLKLDATSLGDH